MFKNLMFLLKKLEQPLKESQFNGHPISSSIKWPLNVVSTKKK